MHQHKEMMIWQRSRAFVKEVYVATCAFPKEELYGLTSQLRRASVSIPANISEGAGRNSNPDFSRFLDVALGSAAEVETLLILSADLNFISQTEASRLIAELEEIQRMINGFNRYLRQGPKLISMF